MSKHSIIIAIVGIALFYASARSQDLGGNPGSYTVTGDDALVLMMPELKTAKAPQWLKPGIRLTWYTASATIPSAYISGITQDPDGQWRDPATGQTYRTDDAAGASGHGLMTLDVIAVHDDVVVVVFGLNGIQGVDGPLSPVAAGAYSTPAGYLSGFWVNPQVLAKHTDLAGAGLRSVKTPYQFEGRKHDALWASITSANSSSSNVTDLTDGMMLHTGMASATAPSTINLNGVATTVGGGTTLAQTTFRGLRKLDIPWLGAPLPPVIANVRRLVYQGTTTVNIPGAFPVSVPCTAEDVIKGRGKDFLQSKWTSTVNFGNGMAPNVTACDSVTGCNQLLPLAIPPAQLALLQQGKVLDRDPVTKITITVSFVGRDQRGKNIVMFTSGQGQGLYREDSIYDVATGLLTGVVRNDPSAFTQTQLSLATKE